MLALVPADTLWLLAADPARDAVHAADTEAALVRRYGRANVRRDSIPAAEGEQVYGTVLFPGDSARTLYVYWNDRRPFRRVESVRTGAAATAWTVWPGVALGTPLADVERLNGRPFRLLGFDWDYGGVVTSWRGGRLAAAWDGPRAGGRRVVVTFNPGARTTGASGEGEFSSARAAVRRADARVGALVVQAR